MASWSCTVNRSRISGTYIARDDNSSSMLELTQTNNGQITGLFSIVRLNQKGTIDSFQKPVNGALDNGQLTLSFAGMFFGLDTTTLAGRVRGDEISLESIGKQGTVQSWVFSRASDEDFKNYADQLKAKETAIAINTNIAKVVNTSEATIRRADQWLSDAQLHVGRIPAVTERYQEMEVQLQKIVSRQRMTPSGVLRSQLYVAAIQVNLQGDQLDMQGENVWGAVSGGAANLNERFAELLRDCATPDSQLKARGASDDSLQRLHLSCQDVQRRKDTFSSDLQLVGEKGNLLNQFTKQAKSRREALVEQARSLSQ